MRGWESLRAPDGLIEVVQAERVERGARHDGHLRNIE